MTDITNIVLIVAALIVGIVAGHGIGGKQGFINGLETGVNLIAWCQNGMQDMGEGDEE